MEFTSAASIKRILYVLLITVVTLAVYHMQLVKELVWLILASLFFAHATLEEPLLRRTYIIIVSGLAAAICVVIGGLVATNLPLTWLFVILVTAGCVWRGITCKGWAYPMVIVNVLAVLSVYKAASLHDGMYRALAIFDALIIVADAQIILLPFFWGSEFNRCRKMTFYHMRQYVKSVFCCLQSSDYPDNVYYYEAKIHAAKVNCMHGIVAMREKERSNNGLFDGYSSEDLQNVFEVIVDIGQLRRRVSDHTVFALNATEINNLEKTIMRMLTAMSRGKKEDVTHLCQVLLNFIQQFDDSFESVVKVAAKEPMAFVLFNAGLNTLLRTIESLHGKVNMETVHA